ncbi:uncharacterized protein [Eucyclogobius newberryi]|uniref:uncharacterized protein n=1 Tax=Eucyclogobius newberryi TaxID=166745 RepID=UPI003B5B4FEB
MGTEEAESELTARPTMKEPGPVDGETDSSVDSPQTPENSDPLNTYKWHTGSKGVSEEAKEAGAAAPPSSTLDKLHKASTNKWKTMHNWRKALSEDPGEKACASGKAAEGSRDAPKSHGGGRKNPFRRALSEPPGVLFSTLGQSSGSSQAAPPSSSATDTEGSGGSPSTDPGQKGAAGGGALFKKYLRTVSQKLKRPRLQSRSSNPALITGNGASPHIMMYQLILARYDRISHHEPAALSEVPCLSWVPLQEVPLWDISNCMLENGQILILQEEEPTMWTRSRLSSCLFNLSMQNLVDIEKGQ